MLDSRKRPMAHGAEFWGSKRRKTSSPSSDQEQPKSQQMPPPSSRSVVALLALTDPTIVTRVMHFVPHAGTRKRGEATSVMGTLVSLCRAVAPFDRDLPRHFGPANHAFWQDMVLRYFDFTTRRTNPGVIAAAETVAHESEPPRLAVWMQLGVSFVPSEYGFLEKCQTAREVSWPRKENAFALFCDLTILVDKLRGIAKKTPENMPTASFLPCIRRPGAIDATTKRTHDSAPSHQSIRDVRSVPFLSRVRRSRREVFVQVVSRQLESWTHFRDARSDAERIDFYAGQSRRSGRWIGLTSVHQQVG